MPAQPWLQLCHDGGARARTPGEYQLLRRRRKSLAGKDWRHQTILTGNDHMWTGNSRLHDIFEVKNPSSSWWDKTRLMGYDHIMIVNREISLGPWYVCDESASRILPSHERSVTPNQTGYDHMWTGNYPRAVTRVNWYGTVNPSLEQKRSAN